MSNLEVGDNVRWHMNRVTGIILNIKEEEFYYVRWIDDFEHYYRAPLLIKCIEKPEYLK